MNLQSEIKNQNQYDTIIIGSGMGALSAAICLAREGQKVLILEQHDVPGGWCHSFYLNGHRFTPGVHYIGLLDEGESTSKLYEGLGIANDLVFFKMNKNAFEHVHIGKERFDFSADFKELQKTLIERFPKEEKNIIRYLSLLKKVPEEIQSLQSIKGFWQKITIPFRTKNMGKYGLFSLKRVIDWHIKDSLLKAILNVQVGDHGVAPARASFPLHAAVMSHYFSGGHYPMGGGGALVKAFTNKIKDLGGEIRTSQTVLKILIEGEKKEKAIGVQLENGEKIFAKTIISNADPKVTFSKLVGEEYLSNKLKKKLAKTKYSCTSLMLFLTVEMDLKSAGIDSGNIWVLPDADVDAAYAEMLKDDILKGETFPAMFISCTTLKDPTSFNGTEHTFEAIVFIGYDAFKKFENEAEKRSVAYLDFKDKLTQKMLRTLENTVPNIQKNIIHCELGTPITNDYYINTTEGNVYGTEKILKQIGPFSYKPQTEIENLYMCGASVLSHGVAGAGYSGLQAAGAILGKKQDEFLVADPSQKIRVFDAESDANYPEFILQKIAQKIKKNKMKVNSEKTISSN